jgi:hypothetical protein
MKREITINVDPSPEELAQELWSLDADTQAKVLSSLAELVKDDFMSLNMQLQYVTDSKCLSLAARELMSRLGDYSVKGGN